MPLINKVDWNNKTIDQLIIAVQARSVLWDRNHPQHHNRFALDDNWEEVAKEMRTDRIQVRQKWKTLRDTYRKELTKVQKSLADDENILYQPTWSQYEILNFLKDQFRNEVSVEVKSDCSEETDTALEDMTDNRTETTVEGHQSMYSNGKRKDLPCESDSNQTTKQFCSSENVKNYKETLKEIKKQLDVLNKELQILKNKYNSFEDADYLFVKYLAASIKEVPKYLQFRLRLDIIKFMEEKIGLEKQYRNLEPCSTFQPSNSFPKPHFGSCVHQMNAEDNNNTRTLANYQHSLPVNGCLQNGFNVTTN